MVDQNTLLCHGVTSALGEENPKQKRSGEEEEEDLCACTPRSLLRTRHRIPPCGPPHHGVPMPLPSLLSFRLSPSLQPPSQPRIPLIVLETPVVRREQLFELARHFRLRTRPHIRTHARDLRVR
jgi:hypothetical protein